jgi:hypothetical protein
MSTRSTRKPRTIVGRPVSVAVMPNRAMTASSSKLKAALREKSTPLGPACGSKLTNGFGGFGSGCAASAGSRP